MKQEGMEDVTIVLRFMNEELDVSKILKSISEYESKERLAAILDEVFPDSEVIRDFDDLGITMIDTDEDW